MNKQIEKLLDFDIEELAQAARLRFVSDAESGYSRKRRGKGFIYLNSKGEKIDDDKIIDRIKSLVIPPAWKNVWICSRANGHIQVTGRDDKGRKQYIYHEKWTELSNETKFFRLLKFGEALPKLRETIETDLRKKSLPREKVIALVVKLLDQTYIRIGNSAYAKENDSYGLTTLLDDHAEIVGSTVHLNFKGKSGKEWELEIKNKRLAKLIKKCQDLPGQILFAYLDEEGETKSLTSTEVNVYLHDIMGEDFTAKDFRTWGGTTLAVRELKSIGDWTLPKEGEKNIRRAIKNIAKGLVNTTTVCKKYYIHPDIFEAYRDKSFFKAVEKGEKLKEKEPSSPLEPEELTVLIILEEKIKEKL